jgi:hypothetical protein
VSGYLRLAPVKPHFAIDPPILALDESIATPYDTVSGGAYGPQITTHTISGKGITMAGEFRFSFGPWNIHEGADPFGPTVRKGIAFARKVKLDKKLGFDGVQVHDDDAVPDLDSLTSKQITQQAKAVLKMLKGGPCGRVRRPALWKIR